LGAQKLGRVEICPLAVENASLNTGILGAAGGQYGDLYHPNLTDAVVLDVIDKKTGSLFEISFVFGWLYGGGDFSLLDRVKQAARSFGRAFQISDDFLDLEQEGEGMNFPAVVGREKASSLLSKELENYYAELEILRIGTEELVALGRFIEQRGLSRAVYMLG
jgi:geranylgeranyl diphosphate synthase, type II